MAIVIDYIFKDENISHRRGVDLLFQKNLNIKTKIFMFIGLSFVITMLVFGGIVFYKFDDLQKATDQSLKNSLLTKEKERIQNATHVMAQNLELIVENQPTGSNQEEITEAIVKNNTPIRFGEAGYFFIYDYEGNTISLPPDREVEGTNRWDLQDTKGKYLIRELAEAAKEGGGFVEYYYENPNTGEDELKYGYVEPIEGTDYFIGSGTYASVINKFLTPVEEEFNAIRKNTLTILSIVFILSLLVMGIIIYVIANRISQPLQTLSDKMAKAKDGDLTVKVDYDDEKEGDEINKIKASFNKMIQGFSDMVLQISETSEELAASSEELSASSEEISASSQQVSSAIQEVAKGAEEQSAQVVETKDNVNHLIAKIENVGNKSDEMDKSADDVVQNIKEGNKSIENSIKQVKEVKNQSSAVASKIDELGELSNEIGNIVELINDISAQTNLLALNAAIEAARAGEAGRGFSVVADEIRELAEESSKATEKIAGLINEIQQGVKETVNKMEDAEDAVDVGVNTIKNTENTFGKINEVTFRLSDIIKEISNAANDMNENSQKVENAIDKIASVSQQVSGNAEEVSASSEEQSSSTEEIVKTSEDLAAMAQELSNKVDQFDL